MREPRKPRSGEAAYHLTSDSGINIHEWDIYDLIILTLQCRLVQLDCTPEIEVFNMLFEF